MPLHFPVPSRSGNTGGAFSSTPELRAVVIAAGVAQFLLPFMVSGLTPMLPAIGTDLSAGAMELGLVGAVYSLSLAIFHLLAGRMGDIIGRRRLFMTGLSIFLCMAALLPFSPNMTIFLCLRFTQAVGTAMMNTSVLAILVACAPPAVRGRLIGIATIGVFAGISCGPAIGGFVASTLGWKWLFWGVVPIGLVAWGLMAFTVKDEWTSHPDSPYDWRGAACWFFGMTGLVCGITWIRNGAWAWLMMAAGILFFVLFFRAEWRVLRQGGMPVLDLNMVAHNRQFLFNGLISLINYSTVLGQVFLFSLYAQFAQGLSMMQAGILLSIQPLAQLILAPVAGRLGDRHGPVPVATAGLVLCGIGLFIAGFLGLDSPVWITACCLGFIGIGLGFFGAPNTSAIMGSVQGAYLSQASGIVGTMRTMGMMTSLVTVSLTMNIYFGDGAVSQDNVELFIKAMRWDFSIFSLLNCIALVLSWRLLRRPRMTTDARP